MRKGRAVPRPPYLLSQQTGVKADSFRRAGMLRLFQVNEGRYLSVEGELTPNSRVSDVCEGVRRGEGGGGVVLMVADGRQMEQSDLLATYAGGMESKPIFVFYQNYLSSAPPSLPTHLKPRPDLERGLSVLSQKPSPSLFQKLPPIAKQLSEYSTGLCNTYLSVTEECGIQITGWRAVLRNCRRIIGVYQKHQQHFSRVVSSFQASRPHYIDLVQSFPEQVKLLQQLPVPPSLPASLSPSPSSSPSTSLYDWISTHDEKNSLVDLCSECEKALAQAEDRQLSTALATSQQLLESCTLNGLEIQEVEGEEEGGGREEAKKGAELQVRMMENIQSTSQRAMRSGDGGTIADLSVSHHKSLQLMNQQCRELEDMVRTAEAKKARTTQHIHKGLRVVTELQMKIKESNSVLVFLHETLKLAKKRFEVLEQVCSCGEVLGSVVAEVERRQTFNQLFTERVVEVSEELRTVREDEKQRRHTFTSSYRHHFLLSLFPQLTHRLPDATCRLSRVPDATDTTDFSRIKSSLPPQFMPPSSSDSFSLVFSHSHPFTSSTSHTSTHSPPSPDTHRRGEVREGDKGTEQAVDKRLKWEEERNELVTTVEQLQGQVTTLTNEREAQAKEIELQALEREREKIEVAERMQQLQVQLSTLSTEREHLMTEMETHRQEREREMRDLTQKLQETEAAQQQLAAHTDGVQQEKMVLEGQLHAFRVEVAEKEGEWENERKGLVSRVAELVQAVEEEKHQAKLHCEELQSNCTELLRQFEMSETMVLEQKSALTERNTEIEIANEARSKLKEECGNLESALQKRRAEVDDLKQQNMQWKEESEKRGNDIEALRKEMMRKIEVLNNRCESLSSENEQLRSGNLPDFRSMGSEGSTCMYRSDREQVPCLGADPQTQTEQLGSEGTELESKQLEIKIRQQVGAEMEQLKVENEQLKLKNEQMHSQLTQQKSQLESEKLELESRIAELSKTSEQLESKLRRMERCCEELQLQNESEKTQFAAHIAQLNSVKEQLQSQCQEQHLREDQLNSQMERLQTQCKQLHAQVEQLESKSSELEAEKIQLQTERDTVTCELEQVRLELTEAEEKSCLECEKYLSEVATLTKILEEREDEFKRSESRHQQALKAYTSAKAQQEQLRLRLVALEQKERAEGGVSSRAQGLQGGEMEDEGKGLQVREKKQLETGGSGGTEVSGGWVLEGGIERGGDVNPHDGVKRLRTELAVERKNRSLLAEELQQVGKERDEFMQKFMEVERELRSHHHSVAESVMTASSSSSAGVSTGESSARSASGQQRRLGLTISNLQVDDVALFCMDSFNNYLALCVDGKTYYLNHSCVSNFTDSWHERVKPPFKKKLLIGRVTKRLHVEVRKEDNRLHVPVGTRLYKLEAVELPQDIS